jgi:hypothetical protein
MDFLAQGAGARAASLDPVGEEALKLAKVIRRESRSTAVLRDPERMDEIAQEYFPLPAGPLLYVPKARGIEVPGLKDGDGAEG